MGVTLCQKHGRQQIVLVCEHIQRGIQQKELQKTYKIQTGSLICQACYSKIGSIVNLTIDAILRMKEKEFNDFEWKSNQINETPICVKCAKDIGLLS